MLTKEQQTKITGLKRYLFFLLTAADEAGFKYDGEVGVPPETIKKWAIEIEEAKKDLYIERMRKRTSVSYWLQWIFPLVCVLIAFLEVKYAQTHGLDIFKDTSLFLWITTGLGGSAGINVARKVSKHAHLRRINGNGVAGPIPEPRGPGTEPVEPEEISEEETEDDGGVEFPSENQIG